LIPTNFQPGFNNLNGLNITCFHLNNNAGPGEPNINGTVFIPNPTIITVAMGNVTFNNYVNGTYIGNSTIQNFVLKPGNNSYFMTGYADALEVFGLVTSDYKNGILPLTITGNSSIYNGEHLTYYERALAANTQHIELNLIALSGEPTCTP
jgi:hypothetical protein